MILLWYGISDMFRRLPHKEALTLERTGVSGSSELSLELLALFPLDSLSDGGVSLAFAWSLECPFSFLESISGFSVRVSSSSERIAFFLPPDFFALTLAPLSLAIGAFSFSFPLADLGVTVAGEDFFFAFSFAGFNCSSSSSSSGFAGGNFVCVV